MRRIEFGAESWKYRSSICVIKENGDEGKTGVKEKMYCCISSCQRREKKSQIISTHSPKEKAELFSISILVLPESLWEIQV